MEFVHILDISKYELLFPFESIWKVWAFHLFHVAIDTLLQPLHIILLGLQQLSHNEPERMSVYFTIVILQSLWLYKYNRQDVLVILQSLWLYKYNRQDVLVILQSLWVYKYNRQDALVILQSLWVYKYNRQDVLVILQSLWVLLSQDNKCLFSLYFLMSFLHFHCVLYFRWFSFC